MSWLTMGVLIWLPGKSLMRLSDSFISLPWILGSAYCTSRDGDNVVWEDDNLAPGNGRPYIWLYCDISCLHSLLQNNLSCLICRGELPLSPCATSSHSQTISQDPCNKSFFLSWILQIVSSSFVEKDHKFSFMYIDFSLFLRHWRGTV